MSFISSLVGRVVPRYRTLGEWLETYDKILSTKPITAHTLTNRRAHIKRVHAALGARQIGSIRPHEVAGMIAEAAATHPHTAKRMLIEAREIFHQAICYGWIERNPAEAIKAPRVKVARVRLILEEWRLIHAWAELHSPPWVSKMLLLGLVTGQRRSDLLKMQFADVWDDHLHITQQKTGAKIALPLAFRLEAVGVSIGEAIDACRSYYTKPSPLLIRKHNGAGLCKASASWRFQQARKGALGVHAGAGSASTLHEIRSLTARLAVDEGVDTQTLLGHSKATMTALYENARGRDADAWKVLSIRPR